MENLNEWHHQCQGREATQEDGFKLGFPYTYLSPYCPNPMSNIVITYYDAAQDKTQTKP